MLGKVQLKATVSLANILVMEMRSGPFVYTGFKPAFVLIKNIDATQVWIMYDGARKPFNPETIMLLVFIQVNQVQNIQELHIII